MIGDKKRCKEKKRSETLTDAVQIRWLKSKVSAYILPGISLTNWTTSLLRKPEYTDFYLANNSVPEALGRKTCCT